MESVDMTVRDLITILRATDSNVIKVTVTTTAGTKYTIIVKECEEEEQ